MARFVDVDVEEFIDGTHEVEFNVDGAAYRGMEAAAKAIQREVQNQAPKLTGALAASIVAHIENRYSVGFGSLPGGFTVRQRIPFVGGVIGYNDVDSEYTAVIGTDSDYAK